MIASTKLRLSEFNKNGTPVVSVEGLEYFDIGKIFDCGQCFRFDEVEHSAHQKEFSGVAHGRFVSFAQDGDTLYIYGSTLDEYESLWRRYLAIDKDYFEIEKEILNTCESDALLRAAEYGRGIRILSQDGFECVISFIISQNNNIPRIKKIIEALCAKCGEAISISDEMKNHLSGKSSLCAFPSAQAILELGEQGLFDLKTGFRAKYIYDAVSRIADGRVDVERIFEEQDIDLAIEYLSQVKGIGKKVASCALLFGFEKYDAFPVDVWMKRVAQKYFPEQKELSGKSFGRYAGIAQQYLFYYERYNNV